MSKKAWISLPKKNLLAVLYKRLFRKFWSCSFWSYCLSVNKRKRDRTGGSPKEWYPGEWLDVEELTSQWRSVQLKQSCFHCEGVICHIWKMTAWHKFGHTTCAVASFPWLSCLLTILHSFHQIPLVLTHWGSRMLSTFLYQVGLQRSALLHMLMQHKKLNGHFTLVNLI